jgi:hypothetical protein
MSANAARAEAGTTRVSNRLALWAGRVLTAVPILLMLFSASMKFTGNRQMLDEFVHRFGYAASIAPVLGVLELTCVVLYAIPRTAVLGAILMTGYLGGAIATHVRIGDPSFLIPCALGVVAWGGIYFRERRLHALLPLRRGAAPR